MCVGCRSKWQIKNKELNPYSISITMHTKEKFIFYTLRNTHSTRQYLWDCSKQRDCFTSRLMTSFFYIQLQRAFSVWFLLLSIFYIPFFYICCLLHCYLTPWFDTLAWCFLSLCYIHSASVPLFFIAMAKTKKKHS